MSAVSPVARGEGAVLAAATPAADSDRPPATPSEMDNDPDHPAVTKKELHAWYAYDAGSSAVSTVVISGFLPLLVQTAGLEAAGECSKHEQVGPCMCQKPRMVITILSHVTGFPGICPNVITNITQIRSVFGNSTDLVSWWYRV